MRRQLRFPLFLAAVATAVIVTTVTAFFVPTAAALALVGIAAILIAIGILTLARRL
jgi:preprotein translocase subunit SecD